MDLTPEGIQARLVHLRADLAQARQEFETARTRSTVVLAHGESDAAPDDLIRDRAEAASRVEAIIEAIQELERMLPEITEAAGRREAEKRLDPALKRAAGSLAAEYAKDVAKVIEAAATLDQAVERFHDRRGALARLHLEASVLTARFPSLHKPELPPVPVVGGEVHAALLAARRSTQQDPALPGPFSVSHRANADPEERRRDTLEALRVFVDRGRLASLSETARQIIRDAGIPEPAPTPGEVEMEARREEQQARDAAAAGPYLAEAAALSCIPGAPSS